MEKAPTRRIKRDGKIEKDEKKKIGFYFCKLLYIIISNISNHNMLIEIEYPKPYKYIGAKFTISGLVHLSWFIDWTMSVYYLGLDVKTFMGTTLYPMLDDQNIRGDKVRFSVDCKLHFANIPSIQNSHGRITIKIASPNKTVSPVYLPLIVRQFEDSLTFDPDIIQKHSEVGKKETQYEQDLKNYYTEWRKIDASRKNKDDGKDFQYLYGPSNMSIVDEILKILEDDEESFKNYAYQEENKREQELNEKYKDALEWQGPLIRGRVSQFDGFELRVYSDDHDQHFHIIHKEKGINARFSFPEIRLINYVNPRNTIGSKAEKKIREFCLRPEIFKRFKKEFEKHN